MINPGSRRIVWALLFLLSFLAGIQNFALAQSRVDDEEAIKRVVAAMDDTFNSHRADTALFTADADFVNVTGTWLHGAADIDSGRRQAFETRLKDARTKSLDVHIRFIRSDVAIVHVTSETTGITTPDGRELPPQKELNIRVFTKEKGQWLVAAFHNTPLR